MDASSVSPVVKEQFVDILWSFAHPDDESFGGAGIIAWANRLGLQTALITATRGEVGKIADPAYGPQEALGGVREQELRKAMRVAGLNELRILGYRDSGMDGTPENDDPRAFVQQPFEEVVAHLVAQIRELRPRTVITFDPHGGYGHPDHIYIHKTTTEAILRAASDDYAYLGAPWQVETLYYTAFPREIIEEIRKRPNSIFARMTDEEVQKFGTPSDEITHWFDTNAFLDISRKVIIEHATQLPDGLAQFDDPASESSQRLRWQTYRRVELPWAPPAEDLFDRLQREHGNPDRTIRR